MLRREDVPLRKPWQDPSLSPHGPVNGKGWLSESIRERDAWKHGKDRSWTGEKNHTFLSMNVNKLPIRRDFVGEINPEHGFIQ